MMLGWVCDCLRLAIIDNVQVGGFRESVRLAMLRVVAGVVAGGSGGR